jgi:hypothetical protein
MGLTNKFLQLRRACWVSYRVFPHPKATTNGAHATTMLKKRIHIINNNPTNPKTQPKQKTQPTTQPPSDLLHTKLLQQQPKRKIQCFNWWMLRLLIFYRI